MSEKLIYWLWLSLALGPCSGRLLSLLDRFAYIEEIYESRESAALASLLDAAEFSRVRKTPLERARRLYEFCGEKGIGVLPYSSPQYPERLRQTRYPPVLLYYTGSVSALCTDSLAGVGARNATRYGRDAVKKICAPLARAGLTLVSGLARGIDSEVHRTALAEKALTVAVLGTAIDTTSPRNHEELRFEIERSGGCVVSEYAPGTESFKGAFPLRNRLISGLARAVLVFEAAKRSGTMITANWALDDGREVIAVPGSIFAPNCEGTNRLIKQGAQVADCAEDVASLLDIKLPDETALKPETKESPVSPEAQKILKALSEGELTLDELAERTKLPPAKLLSELTELELDGALNSLPGPKYALAI
ncbi:MAG: DNA-processing protein DprA [Oscillospiraceae bacterium]|nr:DNA-processing protein DprA [Oscillospiraceae bacterium]